MASDAAENYATRSDNPAHEIDHSSCADNVGPNGRLWHRSLRTCPANGRSTLKYAEYWGESLNSHPEDIEGTFHDNDGIGHDFRGKTELIEAMLNNQYKNGFADALKKFYEEHGFYPPLPDLSKMPRLYTK